MLTIVRRDDRRIASVFFIQSELLLGFLLVVKPLGDHSQIKVSHLHVRTQVNDILGVGFYLLIVSHEPVDLYKGEQHLTGLGVSYSDMIAILKQMCDKGAVKAQFQAGPLPKSP